MGLRIAVVVLAAAACGSHPESPPPEDGSRCPAPPAGYLLCKDSCGNGSVDDCLGAGVDSGGCPSYSLGHESCDGTIAATTAMGSSPHYTAEVSCAATTCWYVAATSATFDEFTAQRFDANAAVVGMPITIAPGFAVKSFLADGDGLLGLEVPVSPNARIDLVRFDVSGAAVAMKAVAASVPLQMFRVGARIGVSFYVSPVPFGAVTTPP